MGELLTPLALSWSGGKDCSFALWNIQKGGQFHLRLLQTTLSENHNRVSMHGVRLELLREQARCIGLPLMEIFLPESATMELYNERMQAAANELKSRHIRHMAFGDLFLEDLRTYRTGQMAAVGIQAHFPVWGIPTHQLAKDFIASGFQAIVVCTDSSKLDASFCGRFFDQSFLDDLPATVDPCGENGEFHTFCFDGPIFKQAVSFRVGERVLRDYGHDGQKMEFVFCELE